jgi:hypothetical protein
MPVHDPDQGEALRPLHVDRLIGILASPHEIPRPARRHITPRPRIARTPIR